MTFNEDSLRQQIVATWGEHGAHVDVFDTLVRDWRHRGELLTELVDADNAAYDHERFCRDMPCAECFDNSGRIEDAYSRARAALDRQDQRDESITGLAKWIEDRIYASERR